MLTAAGVTPDQAEAKGGELGEMAEHAGIEQQIGRLLYASTGLGLLLALWGAFAVRSPRRWRLSLWLFTAGATHLAMLAAGILSRTNLGLLHHTDDVSWLWAATVALELAAVLAAVAVLAARAAAHDVALLVSPFLPGQVARDSGQQPRWHPASTET
jgi:hypothetical protein